MEQEEEIVMIDYSSSEMRKCGNAEFSPEERRLYKRVFQSQGCKILNSLMGYLDHKHVHLHSEACLFPFTFIFL